MSSCPTLRYLDSGYRSWSWNLLMNLGQKRMKWATLPNPTPSSKLLQSHCGQRGGEDKGAGRGNGLGVLSKHDRTWATGECLCLISPSHLGYNISGERVSSFTQLSNQRVLLKGGLWFSEDHFIGPSTLPPGTENLLSLMGFQELCLNVFRNPGFICVAVGFGFLKI